MKKTGLLFPSFGLLCLLFVGLSSARQSETVGGLVTLYAHDDLQSSFDFATGQPGARIEGSRIVLDETQVAFDVFREGMLSFGYSRDDRANLVDVGDLTVAPRALARDGALFPISVFHTLARDGARIVFLDASGSAMRLKEANPILDPLPPEGLYHLAPHLGHTYVLRSERAGLIKFQVVAHQPGHSLTLRWARMPG